ncbi:MAG: hypothetical protein HS107_12720 [Thermoflexaceae bacterium]|nr:hypothetical protein [Thermoflexaceae bacterium]
MIKHFLLTQRWVSTLGLAAVACVASWVAYSLLSPAESNAAVHRNVFCVTGPTARVEQAAAQRVRDAVPDLRTKHAQVGQVLKAAGDSAWEPFSDPLVQTNCIGTRIEPVSRNPGKAAPEAVRRVDHVPVVAKVYLIVVTDEEADRIIGKEAWGRAPYEERCSGDVCLKVSTAVYMREGVLADDTEFARALSRGLGFSSYLEKNVGPGTKE